MAGNRKKSPEQHAQWKKRYSRPDAVTIADLVQYKQHDKAIPLRSQAITGMQAGGYRSPFRGRGMEFVEARPYQPGDDIRHLDWRITARLGKPHSKIFQEERERAVLLYIDLTSTMFFATRCAFKSVVAAHAAAAVAWNACRLGDRVGGILALGDTSSEIRPQKGKRGLLHFLHRVHGTPVWQQTHRPPNILMAQELQRLRRVAKPGGLILIFSDMRGFNSETELEAGQLSRHNDVILCHIFDIFEQTLPDQGTLPVTNGRQTMHVQTGSSRLRTQYEQQFYLRRQYLQNLSFKNGLHYLPLPTHEDPIETLRRGFTRRPMQTRGYTI